MIKNINQSLLQYPLLLSDYNEIWIFSISFRKNTQISYFMKYHPVGAELFHAEGRIDEQTDTDRHDEAYGRF